MTAPGLVEKVRPADLRTVSASRNHIPVLDGVRSIAILMVMVFHFFQHGPPQTNALLKMIGKMSALGQFGVDLFFVLSGFLITGILLDSRHREGALRIFYLRRTLRIFPLYYCYLIGAFLLLPALHLAEHIPFKDQWWFWVYCQNIQDTFVKNFTMFGPGHFWSLAVEEHFYLVWPFVVMKCPQRYLKQVLLGAVALAFVCRAIMVAAGYPVYYFTLCRIDTLALGALLAVMAREGNSLEVLARWLRKRAWWFLIPLVPFYVLFTGMSSPFVQVVKFSLYGGLCAGILTLLLTSVKQTLLIRLLRSRASALIAKGSYAMYVFHPAVFDLLRAKFPLLITPVAMPIAFSATFAAAFLSWNLVENPFLKLRDWIQQRRKTATLVSAPMTRPV